MKKVRVNGSTNKPVKADRRKYNGDAHKRVYDAYNKLAELASILEDNADAAAIFEQSTGISADEMLDAQYDMWHYIYEVE